MLTYPFRLAIATTFLFVVTLFPLNASAQFTDQHSVEALVMAMKSPLSERAIREARDFDDMLMSGGQTEWGKFYLVNDQRSVLVNSLTAKLLAAMGQNAQQWVVRVLDTDQPVANAFVTGGRYIYVFTGLLKEVSSEDELAFILSHELGHSLLKHKERQSQDVTTAVAGIAVLASLLSKKHSDNFKGFAKIATTSYGRGDEEEADAIAVAISRRAGYNPIYGAEFFSKSKLKQEAVRKGNEQILMKMHQDAEQAQNACIQWRQYYDSSWLHRSADNANKVNAACQEAENRRVAYNQTLQQYQQASLEGQFFSTHPENQDRIAAIAALTDYLYGRRNLASLIRFEQSHRVMLALQHTDSILLKLPADTAVQATAPVLTPNANLEAAASELAIRYKCSACHSIDKKIVGPAYREISNKYRGSDVEERLISKVRSGGSGTWGRMPMPPHPNIPDDEIKLLIQWITQLD